MGSGECLTPAQAEVSRPWRASLIVAGDQPVSTQDGPGNHPRWSEVKGDHDEMEEGIGIHARSIGLFQFLWLEQDQKPFDF